MKSADFYQKAGENPQNLSCNIEKNVLLYYLLLLCISGLSS